MNIRELRIGNYVDFFGKIEQVEGVSIRLRPDVGYVEIKGISYPQKGFHFKPVELTEEWLVKFGEMKGKTNNGIYPMYYNIEDNHLYSDDNFALCNKISWMPILYVHQLQNLYQSLTGEELLCKD